MITISIKLSGTMRRFYRTAPNSANEWVELAEGSTVAELFEQYRLPFNDIVLVTVNRRKAELETILREGDEVWAIPLAAGG